MSRHSPAKRLRVAISGLAGNIMRTTRAIQLVSCHAEGEVGDVIIGGVPPPPGDTLWEQSRFIARDQTLRNFVLNEPRGGVSVSYTHLRAHETPEHLVCRLLLEKK